MEKTAVNSAGSQGQLPLCNLCKEVAPAAWSTQAPTILLVITLTAVCLKGNLLQISENCTGAAASQQ